MQISKTKYTLILGDFNAKIGIQEEINELEIGSFVSGMRNERGHMLINYAQENKLYIMNTFFKKPEHRRWTWQSPGGITRNEIDFIISNNRNIAMDTSVLNTICVGSDHRMVRAKIYINTKSERRKYIQNKQSQIDTNNLKLKKSQYQEKIQHQVNLISGNESLNTLNTKITQCITKTAEKVAKKRKQKQQRIIRETLDLIEKRKQLKRVERNNTCEIIEMNTTIRKKISTDIRNYNKKVKETIEEGKSLKNTVKLMREGKNNITKLMNEKNEEITQTEQIIKLIENFYQTLYDNKVNPPYGKTEAVRILVQNIGSEEISDITKEKIAKSLSKMANGKSPGEDGVIAEMLQHGGPPVLSLLDKLYNKCINESTIPEEWNNATVVLLFKKGDKSKLNNYRPISLLSVMYKLFTKIITERLTNKLGNYQPREQAGFRK